jgi:SM-20-related protein
VTFRAPTVIDFLEVSVLDEVGCETLRAEVRQTDGSAAGLPGHSQPVERVRKVTRAKVPPATCARVMRLLMRQKPALEHHFGVALGACEEPQFLRYQTGDFFVAHQDGNTPLIHGASRFRKISAVVFLSAQSAEPQPRTYGGGSLVLHGPYSGPPQEVAVGPPPGTLVAFRAETTHEVAPVTHGERFTIVSWFREPGASP